MPALEGHHWVINSLPIAEKHLGWNVRLEKGNVDTLVLEEIVQRTYPHPDVPEQAYIVTTEIKDRGRVRGNDIDAAPLWMLYHAQTNIREPKSRLDMRSSMDML